MNNLAEKLDEYGKAHLHAYGQYPRLEQHGKYFTVNGKRFLKSDLQKMISIVRQEVAGKIYRPVL